MVVIEHLLCARVHFIQLQTFVFDYENFMDRVIFQSLFLSLRISELVGSSQVPLANPLSCAWFPAESSPFCFSDQNAELGVRSPSKLLCDLWQPLSLGVRLIVCK